MRKTKIVLPSNNGLNIFPGMLGRARQFYIYERGDNGKINFLEVRINPYASTNQHLKTLDVYEFLKDCPVIISARIGKRGVERLEQRGVKLFFRRGKINEALNELRKKRAGSYRNKKGD
ncbi:MAG: NifB/NifX family molybdenum-iron cluster-binding protein [Candidatus Euphemobacter frigidus]|nr:NifB/NifX family molybdenum-iron cluster-binding protein [Candidatus Euphemobacter frigidus]